MKLPSPPSKPLSLSLVKLTCRWWMPSRRAVFWTAWWGYSISPILWEKVRSRLSAGRVQSVALRLVVEREREIDAFVSTEYWSIDAELKPEKGENHLPRPPGADGR